MSVIPAMQEVEMGGLWLETGPSENLERSHLKK
jgi:hypothetical protein